MTPLAWTAGTDEGSGRPFLPEGGGGGGKEVDVEL